jgi:hypothetical protein
MNGIELQNRIVNLDNVAVISKFIPGDAIPTASPLGARFRKAVIYFEFVNALDDNSIFDSPVARFVYDTPEEFHADWLKIRRRVYWSRKYATSDDDL